ncbi:Na+/H+ antiporter NhaA [Microbacterium halimionae]|uniref:Na(+)/H(+) antiporter NhaA n=1 Tax=Microbacterium halimionae TaxID=1526413 RepID=A0A7W3JQB4_9MICO|nr:Na+/H+ antiporter NhaA [Microbacterium halimionae]MBA8817013.1 Na+/H+ antiporter NhaA [Microbacterium halimionae]NII94448.1 Na+/H+ antiporter NhaA [Microbacterium halimionae]
MVTTLSAARSDRVAAALLLLATIAAVVWANVSTSGYEVFWSTNIDISVGGFGAEFTAHELVNEGLMTFFFFLVGLEVKREFTIGELTSRSRAIVPIVAAIAGLAVPALIFIAINASSGSAGAWGVVISTDTAFLLGALALIGPKHPARLRTFLLTLAVVDDVGALIVIAVFYNEGLSLLPLTIAIVLLVLLAFVRWLPAGTGIAYAIGGIALWVAVSASGVHATLAGVAVALIIPVFSPRRAEVERTTDLTQAFRESPNPAYASALQRTVRGALSINERIDSAWRPYIQLGVLPIFALANAGVHIDVEVLTAAVTSPITWGIIAALVGGKFVGITGATTLMKRLGVGELAPGLTVRRVGGGAALSGIGFTIALFLVPLAISDPDQQDLARVGVLAASVIAFALGWAILFIGDRLRPPRAVGAVLNRPVDPARDHIRGPVDARYTIVEYADFECPFCSRATGSVDAVLAHFGDELRWVYRHLPLSSVHPHATLAAQAAEASALQDRFFDFAPLLFSHQDELDEDGLRRRAEEVGLDVVRFSADLHSADAARRVEDDRLDAELMDLHSTPTFFIGEKRHIGPYDSASLIRAIEGQ